MTCTQQLVRVQILTSLNEPVMLFSTSDPKVMLRVIASAYDEHQALVHVVDPIAGRLSYEGSLGTARWGEWVAGLGVYLSV